MAIEIFQLVRGHLEVSGRPHLFRVKVVEGREVVPFEVIDTWHQSSIGRSWACYGDYRVYFGAEDSLVWGGETYLTEAGYAKLAPKCFSDDLSWKVQQALVRDEDESLEIDSETEQAHLWPTLPDVPDSLPDDI